METSFDLTLNSSYIGFQLIVLILAIGLAWLTYRQPNPPITNRLKYFLFGVRVLVLVLVIGAVMEPLLSILRSYEEEPLVVVLLDQSNSMTITDKIDGEDIKRADLAREVIFGDRGLVAELSQPADIATYGFAKSTEENAMTGLNTSSSETDLAQALKFIDDTYADRNLSGMIVLSDGSNNSGNDPARLAASLKVPVHTIGVGDPAERKDISISRFLTNETAYVDNEIPVEITIRSNGFDNTAVPVQILWDEKIMAEESVILQGSSMEQKIMLRFVPTEPGDHKFTLNIPIQDDEFIPQNNRRDFVVRVLKSKIQVLCLAGKPSYDYGFLIKYLRRDPNVEPTGLVAQKGGGFYALSTPDNPTLQDIPRTESQLLEFDLVILVDIPRQALGQNFEDLLTSYVREHGGALLMTGGRNSFADGGYETSPLSEILPVNLPRGQRLQSGPFPIVLAGPGAQHAITMLDENPEINRRVWQSLPPLTGFNPTEAKEGVELLAVIQGQFPALALHRIGSGKVMAMPVTSFWQWDFLMVGVQGNHEHSDHLWSNIIRWLVSRDDVDRVNLKTDKRVYRSGESVELAVQVYDETFQPVSQADVTVTFKHEDDDRLQPEIMALEQEPGRYQTTLENLSPGDYRVVASAHKNESQLGTDTESITISEYSLEYENTQMNEPLLKSIAQNSGGSYVAAADFADILPQVNLSKRQRTSTSDVILWDHPGLFIILIVLLGIEWIMRKRRGLA